MRTILQERTVTADNVVKGDYVTKYARCKRASKVAGALICMMSNLAFSGTVLVAADSSQVRQTAENTVEVGVMTQQIHEDWVDAERRLLAEIEEAERRIAHVKWQRAKLRAYQEGIVEKISDLERKMVVMEAVNLELLPILEKNLDRLQETLESDIPGNMSERRKSLLHAEQVLNDYDMGLLDKTRAVLDSIAGEVDYGHQVNVAEDEIIVDGTGIRVKVLQVGRVGLYAVTLDGEKAFLWNGDDRSWRTVTGHAAAVQEAMEMAEGIRLVGLSSLPVAAPAAAEVQ